MCIFIRALIFVYILAQYLEKIVLVSVIRLAKRKIFLTF